MAKRRFQVGKLIRDHLPEILKEKKVWVYEEIVDGEQLIEKLKEKLVEEVKNSSNLQNLREELADLFEVIESLAKAYGFSTEEIEAVRREKRRVKGGFDRKIYCPYVDIDEESPSVTCFLDKPRVYPPKCTRHLPLHTLQTAKTKQRS